MRTYIAYIKIYLKLTARDRLVLFFNYVFPLVFFFVFGQFMGAAQGGVANQIVAMVLIIGVLGNGLFGAGIRAVQERELNILRRFKVAPIGPLPLLTASLAIGWANYLPMVVLVIGSAHLLYGMPLPENWLSLLVFLSVGIVAFRSTGLIIASVVNSAQEGQIITQLLYFPMLFLSGATFPLEMMPAWLQSVAQFLPASHLFLGIQAILVQKENLMQIWTSVLALLITIAVSTFVCTKLFRWEKEEKISTASKMWLGVVMVPFVFLGAWQWYTHGNLAKVRTIAREMRREHTWLIRDARIFTGDGTVIERGSVLLKGGKVERVFEGSVPDQRALNAELVEASGKTLLPGLIDSDVDLDKPGGIYSHPADQAKLPVLRQLAAYLYCGVVAVRSGAEPQDRVLRASEQIKAGEYLGAEVFSPSASKSPAYISRLVEHEAPADFLNRSLVQQVGPAALLESTRRLMLPSEPGQGRLALEEATERLRQAWRSGKMLVAGTGSGVVPLVHGPAIHRELQLWVLAGMPAPMALEAATSSAATFLGAEGRLGAIKPGADASLLLVDGNPLLDISATERISTVFFRGERVERSEVFDQP